MLQWLPKLGTKLAYYLHISRHCLHNLHLQPRAAGRPAQGSRKWLIGLCSTQNSQFRNHPACSSMEQTGWLMGWNMICAWVHGCWAWGEHQSRHLHHIMCTWAMHHITNMQMIHASCCEIEIAWNKWADAPNPSHWLSQEITRAAGLEHLPLASASTVTAAQPSGTATCMQPARQQLLFWKQQTQKLSAMAYLRTTWQPPLSKLRRCWPGTLQSRWSWRKPVPKSDLRQYIAPSDKLNAPLGILMLISRRYSHQDAPELLTHMTASQNAMSQHKWVWHPVLAECFSLNSLDSCSLKLHTNNCSQLPKLAYFFYEDGRNLIMKYIT